MARRHAAAMVHRWSPYLPPGPFVPPVRVDRAGRTGPTPGQARGPHWVRTSAGLYVPAGTDRTRPEQRIAEAFAAAPSGAAVTGWGALRMHGAAFLDGVGRRGDPIPVQLRVPPATHPAAPAGAVYVRTPPNACGRIRGVTCTDAVTAVFDAARLCRDVRAAVVVIDMAAAARLVPVAEIKDLVASRTWRGVPGVPLVREALRLVVDRSASPPESRLRLVWLLDAGLPSPLVNVPVYDRRGHLIGIPDLLDLVAGLCVEYDGDDHRDPVRHSDDVDREARLRAVGLEVTRVTGRDLARTSELVLRLSTARQRARFLPDSERAWVIGR